MQLEIGPEHIEMLTRRLRAILELVDLEFEGQVVKVNGFSIRPEVAPSSDSRPVMPISATEEGK